MTAQPRPRLPGLDWFRGLAVAGMIIVNSPGSPDHVWWPLEHAAWEGFTPADLVFPAFLFAVGVALALGFPRQVDGALWLRIARRVVLLIALGWAWQLLVRPDLVHIRLMGVLPRLGLCYGLAATFAILTARRDADGTAHLHPHVLGVAAIAVLIGYALLLAAGPLTREGNVAGQFDRAVLGTAHMWRFGTDAAGKVVYDPEGLLSTLPATGNVLFGILAALAWQRDRLPRPIFVLGAVLTVAGLLLGLAIPLNKALWTSSYALLSSGLSALLLAGCTALPRTRLMAPLEVFGNNAILAYMLSLLLVLAALRTPVRAWVEEQLDSAVGNPALASFVFALAILLITLAALIPLHRRGIFLRL